MSIATQSMVVNLQIGVWTGQRHDAEASARVTGEAHAESDAARVNKHLIAKDLIKPLNSAAGAIRTHFYTATLPWKDNGDRLLTRRSYAKFIEKHEGLVAKLNEEVETFVTQIYPRAVAQAEFRMGDLFDPADYPPAESLRRRFYAHLSIEPVAEAGDFRVEMDKDAVDEIQRKITDATTQRIARAMQSVWERLAETLGHYASKMAKPDEVFRDATVRNLEEIVEILPDLNLTNDPQLEAIRQDIKNSLIGYEPKQLRKEAEVRTFAATEAQRIMEDMGSFMNAFAGVKR